MFSRLIALVVAAAVALVTAAPPAAAQGRGLTTLRDTEIEAIIRAYATPLFKAAGLDPGSVRIILVNDRSLNAFVAGGQNLFVNSGLLLRAEHAGQVIGVLAHETGHIAGGHLARLPEAMRNAMVVSLLSAMLGAVAGATGGRGGGEAAGALILGGGSMAQRSFFAFTRTQESSADQAGLAFLESAGQSARGLLEFMEVLSNQELLSSSRQDPYLRTHPMSNERLDALRAHMARSRYSDVPVAEELNRQHRRMRAKLGAFLEPPAQTLAKLPETDSSVEARYGRAIALYRMPDLKAALRVIDGLIKDHPNDPYFHELRGQMLLEHAKPVEALPSYQRAVELRPDAPLLKADLAQVMLELNDNSLIPPALTLLNDAVRRDRQMPGAWRLLAVAYGRDNKMGLAAWTLAEQAMLEGRRLDARDQARRAMRLLPEGSPGWLRAQDIETQALRREDER